MFQRILSIGGACYFSLASTPSAAEPADLSTGNGLYGACTSTGEEKMRCLSFLQGFDAGDEAAVQETAQRSKLDVARLRHYCIPNGVVLGQVYDVVVNYLRNAAPIRQYPSSLLVVIALETAFPCGSVNTTNHSH
jgi:hypothetical protein